MIFVQSPYKYRIILGPHIDLAGEGPFKVFAPTDGAFDKIPEDNLNALLAVIPALTNVLA